MQSHLGNFVGLADGTEVNAVGLRVGRLLGWFEGGLVGIIEGVVGEIEGD